MSTENEEVTENKTLSKMAQHDKNALRGVIDLYMEWYEINWKQHVIKGKHYVGELEDIYEALAENKLTTAITSLENNKQGRGIADVARVCRNIDWLVEKGGREVDRQTLESVWPILTQLKEAVRHAVNYANMLNMCVKGDAQTKAICALGEELSRHSVHIHDLREELSRHSVYIRDLQVLRRRDTEKFEKFEETIRELRLLLIYMYVYVCVCVCVCVCVLSEATKADPPYIYNMYILYI